MYRVEVRFLGEAAWRSNAAALTVQAAYGQARVLSGSRTADQARVVPNTSIPGAVNLRV